MSAVSSIRPRPAAANSSARCPSRAPASSDSSIDARVELARGLPEDTERALVAGVIPDAGRDDAARPGDARHLGQPGDRIGHEMDDELGERRVERRVRERQLLGGRPADVDAGMARPGGGDERLGWVDGGDGSRSEPRDELGRQRTGAASDIERPLARADPRDVGQSAATAAASSGP